MIVVCIQIMCVVFQLFILWRVEMRIKYWKELREEVKEMFETERADFFENLIKEKLD
jgi:hypothetical protein